MLYRRGDDTHMSPRKRRARPRAHAAILEVVDPRSFYFQLHTHLRQLGGKEATNIHRARSQNTHLLGCTFFRAGCKPLVAGLCAAQVGEDVAGEIVWYALVQAQST